jgi:hypothetical protein
MAKAKHILRYNLREKRYFKFDVVRDYLMEISKEEYHALKKENEENENPPANNNNNPDQNNAPDNP